MRRHHFLGGLGRVLLAALIVSIAAPGARAMINETLSCALEAAMPYVEKGFTVREDNWQGKFTLNEKNCLLYTSDAADDVSTV